ncbi:hypothetical protein MVEN_02257300 [Mycena venus]|uniref:Uncharacterized protein n=1 Tax=Mycena venus TaxID=2733690 RepID=A0A8H7CGZ5_9AGAR|nr:hypothetical protein MVEN_02257300 [Mycena venus]
MAREDSGLASDDDDEIEIEEVDEQTAPAAHPMPTASPPRSTQPPRMLTGHPKKMQDKRRQEREKRWTATLTSLNSTAPPAPTPRVLKKAAQSIPCLTKPLEHPLHEHADDSEFLKAHMQYVDWQGEKMHGILDRKQRIIGVLIAPPLPSQDWNAVVTGATAAMRAARGKMTFPTTAMEELLADSYIICMGTYPIPLFQALCYNIFTDYHETKQTLLQKNPRLRCTFAWSPFTALTANLGSVSVTSPHTDVRNKADGIILIPSAVVTHSNTPIQEGEERYSLVQYSAGSLFRWVANGFKMDLTWHASATADNVKFTRWKDAKVKNFTGQSRVEVWDLGDAADFSDLTEDESEAECPPAKKTRQT